MDDFDTFLFRVLRDATVNVRSIHGPSHWARVERNGLYLAEETPADREVIRLFAYLHDCRRLNDGFDPGHGPRAARYAHSIRQLMPAIGDGRFALLLEACEGHTKRRTTTEDTIGVCWDADRLDLPRVGIRPRPEFFHSQRAKSMVEAGDLSPLDAVKPRSFPKR